MSIAIVAAAVAFGLSAWLTFWFSRPGSKLYNILDHPNERSLHDRPTPRTGGVAILIAVYLSAIVAAVCCVAPMAALGWIAAAGLLVAGVSLADDWFGLPVRYRLIAHFAAAGLVVVAGLDLADLGLPGASSVLPALLSVPLTLLFIVWMINLYNFMDGMDGFAGGMAVFGFGTFAVLAGGAGHGLFMVLSLIVAVSAGGFLLFNFPPARIFMGDVGSTLLGFLAAALMLWAERDGVFPLWIGVLVFSPFIVDATVTLVRRVLRGERIWQAHKSHYYQRLVELGWGHRRTVLWEYAVMAACAASALSIQGREPRVQVFGLALWAAVYVVLMVAIGRLEARARSSRTPRGLD